ncbi:hypothetical protein [Coleofasciculus sp. FACHB-129]|uniref:hypothetical protein n=1 Tax=Cyanophyceae TaxID=3028117 RepID=UPI001687D26C|nr:hypothetical protein [Coleofasciculus sp. FACHB-129]MBD1895886.1 hypothetical protein [Coleofasciculus sp. FACHB-129]
MKSHAYSTSMPIQKPSDSDLTVQQSIEIIKNIPDHFIEYRHGIILDFECRGEDGFLLKKLREAYRAKALWLECFWLGKAELRPELTFTEKVCYKPLAQMSMAFFQLADEVHHRFDWAKEQNLRPLEWMVLCEFQLCETAFKNSGYTAEPTCVGKAQLYNRALKRYKSLEDPEKLVFGVSDFRKPIEALEESAAFLAKEDIVFRNSHYQDYLRVQKRCFKAVRDSHLKAMLLDNDSIKVLGRGVDTRGAKSRKKGFQK